MNRISARMARLAAQRRKALVPFVTAGDPSPAATVAVPVLVVKSLPAVAAGGP